MSLLRSSALGLAARSSAVAVAAGTHFWLAREMGPSGYGGFVLALVIQGTVALLSNVGLGSGIAYRVARDPTDARALMLVGIGLSTAAAVVVVPLAWLVLITLNVRIFPELHPGWVAAGLAAVPLRLFQEDLSGVSVGLGRLGSAFVQMAVTPAVLLIALVQARLGGPLDAGSVAAAWLVGSVGAVGIALILTIRVLPAHQLGRTADRQHRALELLSIGSQQTLNLGAWWLLTRTSRAITGIVAGPEAAGRFGISAAVVETLTYVPSVIQLSLFSRIARAGSPDAAEEVRRSTRLAVLGVALASVFVGIGGSWAIDVFLGPAYGESTLAVLVLIPGVIALTPVTIIGVFFLARLGRPALNLVPSVVALAALVPLVWVFTERSGVVGAAIGTSLAYVLAGAIVVALFSTRTYSPWVSTVVPTAADIRALLGMLRRR